MRRFLLATIPTAIVLATAAGCERRPTISPETATTQAIAPATSLTGIQAATIATGRVVETMDAGGYTYVRLQTTGVDIWIAATEFPVKVGERLTAQLEMPMSNYHSKTLNRDFALIYFVPQVAREGQALLPVAEPVGHDVGSTPALLGSHFPAAASATAAVGPIVPVAGALSIEAVFGRRASLAGQSVVVRGKVVKVNNQIMDRNWIHLQDGSGSADKGTNDLTVTTAATAAAVALGDIVTASGVLATAKDFGAGYVYDVILEQAFIRR